MKKVKLNDLGTQLLYTTLPIWVEHNDGTQSSGTSFITIFADSKNPEQVIPVLVTNYHVVQNSKRVLIEIAKAEGEGPSRGSGLRVETPGAEWDRYNDPMLDLAAVPLGPLLNHLKSIGSEPFFRAVTPDLFPTEDVLSQFGAIEEIIFIGYPSGLYDEHNYSPLVRRGITATPVWNDFGGESRFLIDAGVFPGSSGSPVFIFNQGAYPTFEGIAFGSRVIFLGILSSSILRFEQTDQTRTFLGLGQVTKSTAVKHFLDRILKRIAPQSTNA